jgi:hypothetical protein
MPKRTWTEVDIAKLKSLAGKQTAAEIAIELGRSVSAILVQASKLELSLRTRRAARKPPDDMLTMFP